MSLADYVMRTGHEAGGDRRRRGLELAMLWCQAGAKCGRSTAYHPHAPSRGRSVTLLGWLLLFRLGWFQPGIRNQEAEAYHHTIPFCPSAARSSRLRPSRPQ